MNLKRGLRDAGRRVHVVVRRAGRQLRGTNEVDRVERGILIAFVSLRALIVAQLILSLWFQLQTPRISPVVHIITAAAILFSLSFMITSIRRGNMLSRAWGFTDLISGLAALIVTSLIIPRDLHVGSWLHWAPGYMDQVAAMIAAWLCSARKALGFGLLIGAVYLTMTLPGADQVHAVLTNSLNYPMFALAAGLFASYARNLAKQADADRARAIASELLAAKTAAQLEISRYSFMLHGATGTLESLAHEPDDDKLRTQAQRAAARLRNEALLPRMATGSGLIRLEQVVHTVVTDHLDLPLHQELALGRSAHLTQDHALVLEAALRALLNNVDQHAQASCVTIHADQDDEAWEISVNDDGVGFDPDPERFGFGLGTQVADSLRSNQMTVEIDSVKGEGTCVTVKGPKA